jgi:hypothetical protein
VKGSTLLPTTEAEKASGGQPGGAEGVRPHKRYQYLGEPLSHGILKANSETMVKITVSLSLKAYKCVNSHIYWA